MKKINSIISIIAVLLAMVSCETEKFDPVINYGDTPVLTSSDPSGSTYLLTEEDAADELFSFSWSEADFGFQAAITYVVEIDKAGNNFSHPGELASSTAMTYSVNVGVMNSTLTSLEYPTGVENDLEIRVKAVVSNFAEPLYSNVFDFTAITYSVKLPPLYLLGDATQAGWDNNTTLEAPYMSSGKYGIAAQLTAGKWLKFIKTRGQWAPMWGSDGSGDAFSGKLAYRPTESDTDPASIPSPSVDGEYRIDVDIIGLTYTVFKLPDMIYLVGGATTIGWTPTSGLAFTKTGVGKYSLTTTLTTGNGGMKIMASNSGAWAPQWGSDGTGSSLFGKLKYRAGDSDPDPAEIPAPGSDGTYKIDIDLSEYTYKITKQ